MRQTYSVYLDLDVRVSVRCIQPHVVRWFMMPYQGVYVGRSQEYRRRAQDEGMRMVARRLAVLERALRSVVMLPMAPPLQTRPARP